MSPAEHDRRVRRFSLGDGLLLFVALSLSLGTLRANGWFARFPGRISFWWELPSRLAGTVPWRLRWLQRQALETVVVQVIDELLVQLLCSVLLGLTLVQPLMRLRRPRPPLREVVRQSGLAACLGVILGTLVMVYLALVAGIEVWGWSPLGGLVVLLIWPLLGLPPWRMEAS